MKALRLIVWPHYLYGVVAMALVISGIAIVRATVREWVQPPKLKS